LKKEIFLSTEVIVCCSFNSNSGCNLAGKDTHDPVGILFTDVKRIHSDSVVYDSQKVICFSLADIRELF
jgi:hypothetical protein